jgi:hypothetical protein
MVVLYETGTHPKSASNHIEDRDSITFEFSISLCLESIKAGVTPHPAEEFGGLPAARAPLPRSQAVVLNDQLPLIDVTKAIEQLFLFGPRGSNTVRVARRIDDHLPLLMGS